MSDAGPPKPDDDADERRFRQLKREYLPDGKPPGGEFLTAGLELGVTVLILVLVGWWMDGKLGTSPLFILLGCFIGIVGGLFRLVKKATRK